jgi:enamine deaminase RidA (YjgF/YER057c/UK114 family)
VTIAERLQELGIELPAVSAPAANYVPCVVTGDLVHVSGHGPIGPDGLVKGKVGSALTVDEGRRAARLTGLSLLATLQAELGSLDRVERVVKVFGMVNCAPGFDQIPTVVDGCSDLLVEVFGDRGRHARSAVGMAELPFGIAVEIELIARVTPA